tara:strand:- start:2008 stop:2313 length:306 start_codon:yes stop_codon:yes gene_type:complete
MSIQLLGTRNLIYGGLIMKTITRKEFELKKKAHVVRSLKSEIKNYKQLLQCAKTSDTSYDSLIYHYEQTANTLERYLELLTFSDWSQYEAMTSNCGDFIVE